MGNESMQEVLTSRNIIDSKQAFKNALDMALDCVFMFDFNSLKFFYVNQGASKQLGYSHKELLQMSLVDINPYWTKKQAHQLLIPLIKGLQSSLKIETIHQHKNTTLIQVEALFQYIKIKDGFCVAIVRDITERKRTEAKLLQAKQAAEIANHAKSVFLANLNHELRTPLNSILAYTQILESDTTLNEAQQQSINIIYNSSKHLLTLINDILDLSKIEAGKLEIIATDFNLPEFLHTIVELMKMQAQQKGIILNYKFIYSLPKFVRADEKRLRQILLNLLSNAIKFTDQGIVSFKVIYYEGIIRFEIKDTGIGISKQNISDIFLPFKQVGEKSKQLEGTGLGLAISKQLVELMGGKLKVKSVINKGSLFWFEIPLPESNNFNFRINNKLVGPSPTEAAKLFRLIMTGNIKKILANVTQLEQQNSDLLPFAEQVKNLIKGFEMSELKKLVKQYIKE
jgi:PAS domain S-box-containing protein